MRHPEEQDEDPGPHWSCTISQTTERGRRSAQALRDERWFELEDATSLRTLLVVVVTPVGVENTIRANLTTQALKAKIAIKDMCADWAHTHKIR